MSNTEQEMVFPELPSYFTITRKIEGDSVKVTVKSSIHVNKIIEMPNTWSVEFVRDRCREFRGDVLLFVIKRYGLRLEEPKYS